MALTGIVVAIAYLVFIPTTGQASQSCGTSLSYQICLSAPTGVLSGDVSVTVSVTGSSAGIYEMNFGWGTSSTTTDHLLSDFEAPWGFTWRTDRYLDATQYLNVRAQTDETNAGARSRSS